MTGGRARLKPENSDRTKQPKKRSELKLPLPQNVTFFGKHDESKQSRQDDRRTGENGIYARADVEQRNGLRHLMQHIWQRR